MKTYYDKQGNEVTKEVYDKERAKENAGAKKGIFTIIFLIIFFIVIYNIIVPAETEAEKQARAKQERMKDFKFDCEVISRTQDINSLAFKDTYDVLKRDCDIAGDKVQCRSLYTGENAFKAVFKFRAKVECSMVGNRVHVTKEYYRERTSI